MWQFMRGDLDIKKVPDVTFVSDEGIDAGGFTKEFFTSVMNASTSGNGGYMTFEGGSDNLVPVISEEYYQSGHTSHSWDSFLSCQCSKVAWA